jgi:hypothetical protein
MKQSIAFAKIVVYLLGLGALAVCAILLPELVREESVGKTPDPILTYGFLGGAYVLSLLFFVALYQTLKLLTLFDTGKAFTPKAIKTIQNIKACAIVFSIMIVGAAVSGLALAKSVDPTEDVTFIITIGLVLTFVSSVIAIFVAVLKKLLTDAIAMKSENDLIV